MKVKHYYVQAPHQTTPEKHSFWEAITLAKALHIINKWNALPGGRKYWVDA